MPAKAANLHSLNLPDWFTDAAENLKGIHPKWAIGLPSIYLRAGSILPAAGSPWLLAAAREVEREAIKHDLLEDLRRHGLPEACDAWMAAVLRTWMSGKPPLDSWPLAAVPTLGGKQTISVLDDAIRHFARQKDRTMAVKALDALGRIQSAEARERIPQLAACVRDHSVSDEASRLITKRIQTSGETATTTADQMVPSLGLDPTGERWIDYGPRQFRAQLLNNLSLLLFDRSGKSRSSLPPGAAGDDPIKVPMAKAVWNELKTGLKRILKAQCRRLESSMVEGATWTVEDFKKHWLPHPILSRLARSLVWQVENTAVRLTEDFAFATADDTDLIPASKAELRVLHPLQLTALEKARWVELLHDYELMQVIPQIHRHTYAVAKSEVSLLEHPAPAHDPIKPGVLYGVLDNDGWRLSPVINGHFAFSWKCFAADNVTAAIHYSGLVAGSIGQSPDQTVTHCSFHRGSMSLDHNARIGPPIPLGQVPPIAYSESIRRLMRLVGAEQNQSEMP